MSRFSVREKYNYTVLIWLIIGIPLSATYFLYSPYIVIPWLLLGAVLARFLMKLKCPTCGSQVGKRGEVWVPLAPKDCSVCKSPLGRTSQA